MEELEKLIDTLLLAEWELAIVNRNEIQYLWASAIARQQELTPNELGAGDRVVSTVNQMVSMSHKIAWFFSEPLLRRKAIVETVEYVSDQDNQVDSLRAQQLWEQKWRLRNPISAAGLIAHDVLRELEQFDFERDEELEKAWIAEWMEWVRRNR